MQRVQAPSKHLCTRQRTNSCRSRRIVVRADTFCRDVVGTPRKPFVSEGKTYKVTFVAGTESKVIDVEDTTYILDAADRNGIDLPATCRGGICGACVARVVSGEVDQSDIPDITFTLSDEEIEQGMALICMSRAKSDVVLETQCDWGYSLGRVEWKGATGQFENAPDPLMGSKWSELNKE